MARSSHAVWVCAAAVMAVGAPAAGRGARNQPEKPGQLTKPERGTEKKPARAEDPVRALQGELDKAWRAEKWSEVERILERAWSEEPDAVRTVAGDLLASGNGFARPFAAATLARHASVADLAVMVRTLSPNAYRDERRLLARAIGIRAAQSIKRAGPGGVPEETKLAYEGGGGTLVGSGQGGGRGDSFARGCG